MIASIELQVISRILTSKSESEIDSLCEYDDSYYSIFKPHIQFILNHRQKYNTVPDPFTFQAQFQDVTLVTVNETLDYLKDELKKNKMHIVLLETFNALKDLGSGDVADAWKYINHQCEVIDSLDSSTPMDIIHDVDERSRQIIEFNKQKRIPTGFAEIDKAMYGGLSTAEELVILVARTNTGKSWVAIKMMESAQKHGFPVLYYSPEMQASFIGARFDSWRGHFKNSQIHQGKYEDDYRAYLDNLKDEITPAYVLEDKDVPNESVNVPYLKSFVKSHGIKLLVVDGLSYMEDARSRRGDSDYIKYRNLCEDLFKLSKQCGCAVVVMMQANRDSKNTKDDKGEVFPNMYNIEGSDQPARIATQVFAMRQIFQSHILDIRMEKARNANNQKPEFSYSWDVNTGNMQFIADRDSINQDGPITPVVNPGLDTSKSAMADDIEFDNEDLDDIVF